MHNRRAMILKLFIATLLVSWLSLVRGEEKSPFSSAPIDAATMQRIYDEVKTPFKVGIVIEPPEGKKVDCPTVFRHGDKWYMVYVEFQRSPKEGYTTQIAESDDLIHWNHRGTILDRGGGDAWDHGNAGGGIALFDTKWGGSNTLEQFQGRYWISYLGSAKYGYEVPPLSIGMAFSRGPSQVELWRKLPQPVLRPSDADARQNLETATLYKSFIFHDEAKILGAPFVMFYNAKGNRERIFTAVADDMMTWKRFGVEAVIDNPPPHGARHGGISGDPQIVRMEDVWVMFYFGAFWKPGAFDTFAASRDLVHWTKWSGEDLMKASEPYDAQYAHKPWIIKHDGIVYHFYCAVAADQHRAIALATSKEVKK